MMAAILIFAYIKKNYILGDISPLKPLSDMFLLSHTRFSGSRNLFVVKYKLYIKNCEIFKILVVKQHCDATNFDITFYQNYITTVLFKSKHIDTHFEFLIILVINYLSLSTKLLSFC